jgi:uncharacterized protein (TIGR00725 family)
MKAYVAVVGPGDDASDADLAVADEVGRLLARDGAVVITGGLGGVMAAAARGASAEGGVVVGLLPGTERADGHPAHTLLLPTGLGEMRNALIVRCADAVIAIGGSWGTLSEVALAVRTGVPVVSVGGWRVSVPDDAERASVPTAATAAEAVAAILR